MIVLGIETSCDETAAALVEDGERILSSVVASQIAVHSDFGGVVPELASREHVDNICFVVESCLEGAGQEGGKRSWPEIEAVAVTRGPGLVGALLVGMAYAKGLAFSLDVPFVGVNHLQGHLYSIYLDHPAAELPALSLVVSGGHTNLYHLEERFGAQLLARTRDDAAGEALDKLSKFLGLGYPGGPVIDRLAPLGDPEAVPFRLPKISDQKPDFSFSGLKSAALRHSRQENLKPVSRELVKEPERIPRPILDLVASFQRSVVDQLIDRLDRMVDEVPARSIQISGGVSCNSELRRRASEHFKSRGLPVYFPRPALTTDNAAMIAAAAFRRLQAGERDSWELQADPNLALSTHGKPKRDAR